MIKFASLRSLTVDNDSAVSKLTPSIDRVIFKIFERAQLVEAVKKFGYFEDKFVGFERAKYEDIIN